MQAVHDGRQPLHRAEHLRKARHELHALLTDVIAAAAGAGHVRTDVRAGDLATYASHALGAAADLPATRPARTRLVDLTMAALRPTSQTRGGPINSVDHTR